MKKAELLKKAKAKLKTLTKEELKNFVEEMNCCPHKHTEPCGMDTICKDCGDWV